MISPDLYLASLRKTRKSLSKKLLAYSEDQSSDSVHDLRTSARRLLACIQLLPKTIRRKKKTRNYSDWLEKLVRINASIRDIDIITSKVSSHRDAPALGELLNRLRDSRRSALRPALDFASSKKKGISIDQRDLSEASLQKRFDKVNRKLESRIKRRLPLVLEDPARKQELHRLREDSRKLRYTLDIAGTPRTSEPMPLLRSWQDLLGEIHDSDIMIDYLQYEKQSPDVQDLLRGEIAERNGNFERFASMATTKLALSLSQRHSSNVLNR